MHCNISLITKCTYPKLEMYPRLTSAVIQFWQIGSSSSKLDSKSSSMLMMSRKISPTLVDIGSSNGTILFLWCKEEKWFVDWLLTVLQASREWISHISSSPSPSGKTTTSSTSPLGKKCTFFKKRRKEIVTFCPKRRLPYYKETKRKYWISISYVLD